MFSYSVLAAAVAVETPLVAVALVEVIFQGKCIWSLGRTVVLLVLVVQVAMLLFQAYREPQVQAAKLFTALICPSTELVAVAVVADQVALGQRAAMVVVQVAMGQRFPVQSR